MPVTDFSNIRIRSTAVLYSFLFLVVYSGDFGKEDIYYGLKWTVFLYTKELLASRIP